MTQHNGGAMHDARHIDTDTLSDHVEGLLDVAREQVVSAHLASCADCRAVVHQLAQVRAVLSSLPQPEVPADVAARLDATIARAQQERAEVTGAGRASASTRTGGGWSRLVDFFTAKPQLVAGAAVIVVAAAVVGGYLGTRPSGTGEAGSTPSSAPTRPVVQAPMMSSGTKYTSAQLGTQARAMVHHAERGYTPAPGASKTIASEMRRLSNPRELAGCIDAITRGNTAQRVIAADLAEFDGQPAAIVVLSMPHKPKKYEVTAVGAGCRAGSAHVLSRTVINQH